jgi:F-box domain
VACLSTHASVGADKTKHDKFIRTSRRALDSKERRLCHESAKNTVYMFSSVHRNGGAGAAMLLEQLPPGQLPLRLVLQYLSPKDVVAFQSTCRFLYQAIGLTPLDPPRPCFRLESHPMGFKTSKQYFRVCPFFTSSPANLRRVHSCQVSVEYGDSERCRFRVVACQASRNADSDKQLWNPITVAKSNAIVPSECSRITLTFIPFGDGVTPGGSSNTKYYLVACGLRLSVQKVSVRTFLFDNSTCAVFNRSSRGGEPLTSELRQQYQFILSGPLCSTLPFLRFPFERFQIEEDETMRNFIHDFNFIHCFVLLRVLMHCVDVFDPKDAELSGNALLSSYSNNLAGLGIFLRACRVLRAPRLPCDARAIHTWLKILSWSLPELLGLPVWMLFVIDTISCLRPSWLGMALGISNYELLALETILGAAIDEQHDVLEDKDLSSVWNRDRLHTAEARKASRDLREQARRPLDDADQQVSKQCHGEIAVLGVLQFTKSVAIGILVGSGAALARSAMLRRR